MAQMYGHKWTSSHGEEIDPKNVWAAALRDLSESQIRAGLNSLAKSHFEWPPSVVEFRILCEKSTATYGDYPTREEAYALFCQTLAKPSYRRDWETVHPAIAWVYRKIGSFTANSIPDKYLRPLFFNYWPLAVKAWIAGEITELKKLPAPPPERPFQESDIAARDEGIRNLKELLEAKNEANEKIQNHEKKLLSDGYKALEEAKKLLNQQE